MRTRVLLAALVALLASGCQRTALLWANRGLPPPEASVVYAPALGMALDVYKPSSTGDKRRPVVVFFYGGGWSSGRREDYRFVGRRLAEAGIVAVVADYRTWPATGFPGFVEDGARAVAWARANAADFGGDPERLYVAGHSAGAQIAALIGSDPRYLRAHGLQPHTLAGVIGLSGPYDFDITVRNLAPAFRAIDGDGERRVARGSGSVAHRVGEHLGE